MVVDGGVDGRELLQTSHPTEPEHRPLQSSEREVRVLRPVVGQTSGLPPVPPHRVPSRRRRRTAGNYRCLALRLA